MIKKLLIFLALSVSAFAQSTTTITGNLKNLGTGTVSSGSFVRFYLRGCAGNLPRINGTAIIAPTLGNVYYFDFVPNSSGAISGTLYSTRDATGLLGGAIECGGSTTAVWYGYVPFLNGKAGPETPVHAKASASLDISNITPITTNPVITAPTGDSTYLRLDAGNGPLTAALSGTFSVNGAATTQSINGDLWLGTATGQYASMAACYAALSAGQTCNVPNGWTETFAANLALTKSNTGFLFHGSATITMSTFSVTKASAINGNFFRSVGGSSNPGVAFVYTGSGTAFNIGDSSADSKGFVLEGVTIDTSGGGASALALTLARNQEHYINGLKLVGSGTGNTQIGLNLDGTGNFTGGGVINNVFIGSYGTCVNLTGVVSGFFAANVNKIHGGFITTCTTAVNFGVGVSNVIDDIAIQSSTTAVNFASNASVAANRISFYTSGNTTDVAFNGGTETGNYADVLGTASPVVTGTRGNNTVNWTPKLNWDGSGNVTATSLNAATGANFDIKDSGGNTRFNITNANHNTFGRGDGSGGFVMGISATATVGDTTGTITSYGSVTTAGQGVPPIYGATLQKSETGSADANVLTVTPPAAAGTYRVSVAVSVASGTSGVISYTVSWTDSNGNAQSNIAGPLFQYGTAAPNTTFTTSAAGNYKGDMLIDINNAAANIVVKWVGGGTTAAKMSAAIERLQ